MNITIKATNTSLTPAIEDFINKKLAAFDKIIPVEDSSAHIAVEVGKLTEHHKSGEVFFAELNLHIAGRDFRTRREAGDIYSAFDIVKDELLDAVRTYKGKRMTMLRRGSLTVKNMLRGFTFKRKR